ncbi:CENP-B homolog protein 2-like [Olea europaea var. sylvestris]|uniref:CENP-B homolog protein 2-like n=1 Tax=Olea europaea var. sylvestris TaxID=158386 RepID=UPI000C1D1296|nr:CENP-B homolog protein 2-like [Olea europaea var. sylvestris]
MSLIPAAIRAISSVQEGSWHKSLSEIGGGSSNRGLLGFRLGGRGASVRQDKVNMSGEIIQGRAKEFLQKMYGEINPEFSFSSGWLERFKARYGIKSYLRFGESGSVIMENIENALPGIRSKLDQFQLKDIYNMDETILFYRLEADHSLATKQLERRKKDKERITVVVCCNGDGSDKVPLWIIDFVGWFDKRMNGRKVLLIVDNCPAHPKVVEGLINVELFFLPPNTTSKIQPCDTGIIRAFKAHYRRRFYSNILQGLEVEAPNPEKINILNAIKFANMAWNFDVKTTTIANCFRHYKIRLEENNVPEPKVRELDEGVQELNDVISNLHYRNMMNVEHLLNYPSENDAIMELSIDEEIIQSVMNSNDDENDHEPDDGSVVPNVLSKEAFQSIVTLSNYLLQHEQNIPEVVYALQKVKDEIHFGLSGKKK